MTQNETTKLRQQEDDMSHLGLDGRIVIKLDSIMIEGSVGPKCLGRDLDVLHTHKQLCDQFRCLDESFGILL